jgi:hypothetical protein
MPEFSGEARLEEAGFVCARAVKVARILGGAPAIEEVTRLATLVGRVDARVRASVEANVAKAKAIPGRTGWKADDDARAATWPRVELAEKLAAMAKARAAELI